MILNVQSEFTLAMQLGCFLERACKLYGQNDASFTCIGIWYAADGPYIRYVDGPPKRLAVILSDSAADNLFQAQFQMGHEVIHLLGPSDRAPSGSAPVIEEGLAVYNSSIVSRDLRLNYWPNHDAHAYLAAARLVMQLLIQKHDAILRIRAREKTFAKLTPALLLDCDLGIDAMTAERLCMPFGEFAAEIKKETIHEKDHTRR